MPVTTGAVGVSALADAATFEWVCDELERSSSLDRLEARGTVRLALKQAGLEARSVTVEQMTVVIERVLADELSARGVESPDTVVSMLATGLKNAGLADTGAEAPDAIFERLGG